MSTESPHCQQNIEMQYFDDHFQRLHSFDLIKVSHSSIFNWQHNLPKIRGIGGLGCEFSSYSISFLIPPFCTPTVQCCHV